MNSVTRLGGDPATVLFLVVIVSLPITLLVSLWIIGRYRKAVAQAMKQTAAQSISPFVSLEQAVTDRVPHNGSPRASLQIRQIDVNTAVARSEQATIHWQRSKHRLQQIALAYDITGGSQALLLLLL